MERTRINAILAQLIWLHVLVVCRIFAEDESGLSRSPYGGSSASAAKDQQMFLGQPFPLFLEENKIENTGTDNHVLPAAVGIPAVFDHVLNSYLPQATLEQHRKAVVTLDPDQHCSLSEIMNDGRRIGVFKHKAGKGLGHKSDGKLATKTNSGLDCKSSNSKSVPLAEVTESPEEGQYMNTLTTIIKTENEYDCSTAIIKVEPESKMIDDRALSDESHESDKQVPSCHNNSKPSVQNSRGTSIYCSGCERTFKIQSRYESHLIEKRCKLICQVCGKEFKGRHVQWMFNVHMKYHNKQKDHECKICGKLFIEKSKMLTHEKMHTDPKPKICDKCGKRFPNTTSLRLHVANMHVEERDKYQCSKCPKMFLSSSSLQYHMRSAHEPTVSFPCLTCNKTFKQKRLLKIHEVTHSDSRDIKCDKCDASFKRKSDLKRHMKTHGKAYTHFCAICNKGFNEKRKLLEHENTHSDFRPYACSICEYRCNSKSNLPRHMKIHHKDTCDTCT